MAPRFTRFEEFWPFYLAQHRHPTNRKLHLAGTLLALGCLALAVASPLWLIGAPFLGYGFAWLGHFAVERNRPATFGHPIWSLRADFRMFGRMLSGRALDEAAKEPQAGAGSPD